MKDKIKEALVALIKRDKPEVVVIDPLTTILGLIDPTGELRDPVEVEKYRRLMDEPVILPTDEVG